MNVGFEPQRTINYKTIVDEAIGKSGANEQTLKCIIFNRPEEKAAKFVADRDADWNDLMAGAREYGDCQPVEANHPLYILYTSGRTLLLLFVEGIRIRSGTTGTPKAIVRPTGGYAVALQWTMKYLYNVRPGEIWWSAADLGWVRIPRAREAFSTDQFCLGRWSFLRMLRSVAQWFDQCFVRRQTDWHARRFVLLPSSFPTQSGHLVLVSDRPANHSSE